MKIGYVILRVIRHFLPERFTRFLLRRGIFIRPGLETSEPGKAAGRYAADLQNVGTSIHGKKILVFGYGGRFAIAVELLKLGASHVTLTDLFAPPDDHRNDHLLLDNPQYLVSIGGQTTPRPEYITLLHGDIREKSREFEQGEFDLVVSTSVYEHLDDVNGITSALHHLVRPEGYFIAYIDLRDHYFSLPFEMLTYSEDVWRKWLNPTSNLNRLRLPDYQHIIGKYFPRVTWEILECDMEKFLKVKSRIREEFISGDDLIDAVSLARVIAQKTGQ